LCEKALINHRMISQDHLEVDGLAKQMVQMVKWGLQKYGLHKGHNQDWDLNYHGYHTLWGISSVDKLLFHFFHHTSYCLTVSLSYQP